MISKSRLEELIEQGATIWTNNICPIKLANDNQHNIELYKDCLYIEEEFTSKGNIWWEDYTKEFRDLFETKEEAEWYREFGCIERTERLELPTWEEFRNHEEFNFIAKKSNLLIYVINHFYDNEIYITDLWGYAEIFEYTKEGYTLACRKAKELFLGEKE